MRRRAAAGRPPRARAAPVRAAGRRPPRWPAAAAAAGGRCSWPGRGAGTRRRAGLAALAEQLGALLATSAVANGLFRGNPCALGISGGFASPLAAELIGGADLIVGWGCSLNMWTMRHGALVGRDAAVIQVDVEPTRSAPTGRSTLGVLGDSPRPPGTARRRWATGAAACSGYRTDEVRTRIAAGSGGGSARTTEQATGPRSIRGRSPSRWTRCCRRAGGRGGLRQLHGLSEHVPAGPRRSGFCFTQAYQSIGLGLATAIGAALARPDRLTVAALGDGGALMGIAELETVVRLGLPMVVVVYNDGRTAPRCTTSARTGTRSARSGSPTPTSPRSAAGSAATA